MIEDIRAQYHLDQPLLDAVLLLDQRRAAGRPRPLDAHQRAGAGADAREATRDPAARHHGDDHRLPIGIPAGVLSAVKKDSPWTTSPTLRAVGPLDAEFLARHHAHPAVLGAARLASGLGLREPVDDWQRQPATDDHAGLRARPRGRRRPDAPHSQRDAAGAAADYVRTARAKGLNERRVVLKHALRNALSPIITLGALEFGTLLSGAVLTEQVFSIPGFGKLIVDAVFNRDYAVVQGVVLSPPRFILLNLLADLAILWSIRG